MSLVENRSQRTSPIKESVKLKGIAEKRKVPGKFGHHTSSFHCSDSALLSPSMHFSFPCLGLSALLCYGLIKHYKKGRSKAINIPFLPEEGALRHLSWARPEGAESPLVLSGSLYSMLKWDTRTHVHLPSLGLLSLTDNPPMDPWLLFILIACLLISLIFLTSASVLSYYIHIISRNSAENIRNGLRYRAFTHHGNTLSTLKFFGLFHPKFKM